MLIKSTTVKRSIARSKVKLMFTQKPEHEIPWLFHHLGTSVSSTYEISPSSLFPARIYFLATALLRYLQPRSQAPSSPERKTLVGSGHVAPTFWVLTNKINVEDVLEIDSCCYLA